MSSHYVWTFDPTLAEGDVYNYGKIPRDEMEVREGWKVKIREYPAKTKGNITIPNMSKKGKEITIESVWRDKNNDDWIRDTNGRKWDLYWCMINWC